ncbi:FERM domain-containing protein 8 isoform X2 [Ischnura elegans]|uniref:FERM domain-containing protein 8 isoform X2 n=1 Tax=Ischnura elegans TaxID=197161 RepID=UPI001ED8AE1D|nr:FERM domain-containing protein 8 isoform X2 [Ischnura elegans]
MASSNNSASNSSIPANCSDKGREKIATMDLGNGHSVDIVGGSGLGSSQSYITVIPVDYPRRVMLQPPPGSEFLVEQYSDYLRERARDDYLRGEYNLGSGDANAAAAAAARFEEVVGPLYTVSQRFEREKQLQPQQTQQQQHRQEHQPSMASAAGYAHDAFEAEHEWEREQERAAILASLPSNAPDASGKDDCSVVQPHHQHQDTLKLQHCVSQAIRASNIAPSNGPGILHGPHPIQTCVYLMSGVVVQLDVEAGIAATAQDLLEAVLSVESLGLSGALPNSNAPAAGGARPVTQTPIFALWMCSGLLEVQLKPHHRPWEVRCQWMHFLNRFSQASESRKERDDPIISLQRNVFLPRREEEKIKDQHILDLLYEEASFNIVEGRYPCEVSHYVTLGGIQARIKLGPYNPQVHTIDFFRQQQRKLLPSHVRRCRGWSWLPGFGGKSSPEVRLLEHFKRIPSSTATKRLVRKYLEFCWSLPFYGGAFFRGQVEEPVRGLTSLVTHQDLPVLIAINSQGVYVVDDVQCTMLLGLKYEELSWDFAKPSRDDDPDCLPCLFLQFMVLENGARVSKILQVFSKQAAMMDALISSFVQELKQKVVNYSDEVDRPHYDTSTDSDDTQVPLTMVTRRELPQSCLSNKLSKLTLATFDEDGRCIGQMGSWSFSH